MRNFHPSSRLVSGEVELTNPTEGELLTQLGALAEGRRGEVRLEREGGEHLRALPGSGRGLLRLSKDKGPGRGVFAARSELDLGAAERVFSAYLAGDPDFDRGMKWQPVGTSARAAVSLALAAALALAALIIRGCG